MKKDYIVQPIAIVRNDQHSQTDTAWGKIESKIILNDELPITCLDGIEKFSHLEVLFVFDKASKTVIGSEHPRENPKWPKVGIFAQRKKDRPNHIGATIVNLIKKEGRVLTVKNLDAIDGTPIIDIKPIMIEYLPKGKISQPKWSKELMREYW